MVMVVSPVNKYGQHATSTQPVVRKEVKTEEKNNNNNDQQTYIIEK